MLANVSLFLLGLVILMVGAEALIRGAVRVARRLGVSPFVIGLTLVGFGTSAPELVVNLSAALSGVPDLATGNVVGSNIANVGLILGAAALVRPLTVQMRLLKVEVPIVIGVSLLLWGLSADGHLSRADGAVLLGGFAAMAVFVFTAARREARSVRDQLAGSPAISAAAPGSVGVNLLLVGGGLAGLVGGAELMVRAAVAIAQAFGVSELVIGLTVVAIGTSLPELASTLAAAYRRESDIAAGNVVGSNIFNILLILGTTATVRPLPVAEALLTHDFPVMLGFAVALLFVIRTGLKIQRWEGGLLLAAYAAFIGWQAVRAAPPG